MNTWTPIAQLWHLFAMLQEEIAQGRESLSGGSSGSPRSGLESGQL